MPIIWRDALNVDHGIIDDDHRHLIDLINSIERIVTDDLSVRELQGALDQLALYTGEHFAREEDIMISHRYVKFDDHKAQHLRLIDELTDAAKPIRAAADADATASKALQAGDIGHLSELLRHWLLDHIIKEDLKLKASLRL
jgi:hemerythrin